MLPMFLFVLLNADWCYVCVCLCCFSVAGFCVAAVLTCVA